MHSPTGALNSTPTGEKTVIFLDPRGVLNPLASIPPEGF
jgi:hypothetical protein